MTEELRVRPLRPQTVHGVPVGIMMLDTGFERIFGDIGFAPTWNFPVQYKIVTGAVGTRVTSAGGGGTLDDFVAAAIELAEFGVGGIATSCGFLARFQKELTARCPVPVAASSLLQIPLVQALLPAGQGVGVLTANKPALTDDHFIACGAPTGLPIVGMPDPGVFKTGFRKPLLRVDRAAQEAEVMVMAETLLTEAPGIGAIVMECTNLAPFSRQVSDRFGVPVYDVVSLVNWFQAGLQPRDFSPRMAP